MKPGSRRFATPLALLLVASFVVAAALPARAQQPAASTQIEQSLAVLQAQDLRLARIGEPILAGNARLCTQTMPLTGMVLHSLDQYGPGEAAALFANGPLAIAAVVPGAAADRAGLRAGDAIVSVNARPTADLVAETDAPLRDALFELLASQPPAAELVLEIHRGADPRMVVVQPQAGCRVLVEIMTDGGLVGRSDGRVIQITYELASLLDDDGLAVIFAHELAHSVLHHRRRLEEAGVQQGLLGEVGRNQQRGRQVEVEADRLSAHLLANAGLDPQIAPRFWNSATGRQAGGGLLRSFIYPSPSSRGELIAREIANYLPLGRGPSWPGHLLALRDQPF